MAKNWKRLQRRQQRRERNRPRQRCKLYRDIVSFLFLVMTMIIRFCISTPAIRDWLRRFFVVWVAIMTFLIKFFSFLFTDPKRVAVEFGMGHMIYCLEEHVHKTWFVFVCQVSLLTMMVMFGQEENIFSALLQLINDARKRLWTWGDGKTRTLYYDDDNDADEAADPDCISEWTYGEAKGLGKAKQHCWCHRAEPAPRLPHLACDCRKEWTYGDPGVVVFTRKEFCHCRVTGRVYWSRVAEWMKLVVGLKKPTPPPKRHSPHMIIGIGWYVDCMSEYRVFDATGEVADVASTVEDFWDFCFCPRQPRKKNNELEFFVVSDTMSTASDFDSTQVHTADEPSEEISSEVEETALEASIDEDLMTAQDVFSEDEAKTAKEASYEEDTATPTDSLGGASEKQDESAAILGVGDEGNAENTGRNLGD